MSGGRVHVFGVPLDPRNLSETIEEIDTAVRSGRPLRHASLNAAKVVAAQHDRELREALSRFELVTADGQAVVWAARLLGHEVPERVAGIDLMERLLARAAANGFGVYLLGAQRDVLERAEAELRRRYPGLQIAGARDGYFGADEEDAVVAEIRASGAALLFVALGTPEKELFLARRREELGVAFAMGVGGAFDVLAGLRRRAPEPLQRLGLEWAFRLAQEPRRLARRYAVGNGRFLVLVARELARSRRPRTT